MHKLRTRLNSLRSEIYHSNTIAFFAISFVYRRMIYRVTKSLCFLPYSTRFRI